MPACSRNRTCLRMPALINIGGWKDGRREFCKEEPRFRIGWISEDHKKEKLRFRVGLQSSDKAEPRFVSGGFPKSEKRRSRFVVLPGQSFEE
ncbi:unnamed protein product [Rhizophagus irregularis]|nr:unnamed protein product [Rhizophagus irregularis]